MWEDENVLDNHCIRRGMHQWTKNLPSDGCCQIHQLIAVQLENTQAAQLANFIGEAVEKVLG